MHKRRYIIDPQTHIFQQDFSAITTENKKTKTRQIKKSVEKYLSRLPDEISNVMLLQHRPLYSSEIRPHIDSLVKCVYDFQIEYVNKYIKDKDYDKYLKFTNSYPAPKMVVAPYFMLKSEYDSQTVDNWLSLNSICLEKTIEQSTNINQPFPTAAQIVIDKDVLLSNGIIHKIKSAYSKAGYEYVFIWVDDYDAFDAKIEYTQTFSNLIASLNEIGKKPIMAYGGYESIVLCNSDSPSRLYGVAQSVGYGEYRPITPVGGGMPVNKYYFLPTHRRLRFDDAANILYENGYFSDSKSEAAKHAKEYYSNICNCKKCREIIKDDINNFVKYNDSTPFEIKTKSGTLSRNRPTADASLIAAFHFLHCKVDEWTNIGTKNFKTLISELKSNYQIYDPQMCRQIDAWCEVYGC